MGPQGARLPGVPATTGAGPSGRPPSRRSARAATPGQADRPGTDCRPPGSHAATEVARMSGRVVHFEIPYDDGDRAGEFYRAAFGWQLQSMPGMGYTLVTSGPSGDTGPTEAGFINGGMLSRQDSPAAAPVVGGDVGSIGHTPPPRGPPGGEEAARQGAPR